jgi:metal-sulfur cluster biosynthetic enzyme
MATRDEVLRALTTIRHPDLGRDVVSLGMVSICRPAPEIFL